MADGTGCTALEESKKVLSLNGVTSFFLTLDLGSLVPRKMTQAYSAVDSNEGLHCILNMSRRIDHSLAEFKQKVEGFRLEQEVVKEYIKNHALGSRQKRLEIGTVALLISFLSFFLSTSGLVVTEQQIDGINRRLDVMSNHLDKLNQNQKSIYSNLEFLYAEEEFIGLEMSIVTKYINDLRNVYSCNYLDTYFQYTLSSLETKLDSIFNSLINRKLSVDIVNRETLDKVTSNSFFGEMIYLMNPSALYINSQIDLVTVKDDKLTLLVTFPVIERVFRYKRIDILEAPAQLLFEKMSTHPLNSFLVPIDLPLNNLTDHLEDIRTTQKCIYVREYEACDINTVFSYNDLKCVSGLLMGDVSECGLKHAVVFDYEIMYSEHAALLYLTNGSRVVDTRKNIVLYKSTDTMTRCVYLLPAKFLKVISDFRSETLFETRMQFHVKNTDFSYVLPNLKLMSNLTTPVRNHSKIFTPISFDDFAPDVNIIAIVAVSVTSGIVFFCALVCVIRCIVKRRTVDGADIFTE